MFLPVQKTPTVGVPGRADLQRAFLLDVPTVPSSALAVATDGESL
jgi:hypothetical protein